ncbi:conjugal transfer protein [Peribacillus sp. NPDC097295]|uniref:conjugal transfer protein n=1 Tax=Peribacillus sp. NPDC097295 TaxID=3364402 RepID=UPI0037FB0266
MKKRKYPQTIWRKKAIKAAFWTGFAMIMFLSIVAIVRVGNAGAGTTEEKPVQKEMKRVNPAAGEGGKSFAQNFAIQYFDWQDTEDGKERRKERLAPFLAKGLDEQAGLSFEGMEWGSILLDSQIWNVKETGKDTALITIRLRHTLNKTIPPDLKAVERAAKKKKTPPKATEEKDGPHEKYWVVPIKTDGKSFVVHKIPHFKAAEKKPDIKTDTLIDETGKIMDSQLEDEIKTGLNTFFKVYTTGTQEELSYYLKGEEIPSMNGVLTFKQIKNIVIKQGEGKDHYDVQATVLFEENRSKAQLSYPYEIKLVKEESRWFVQELKNQ